jgi:hypothetical protein
MHDPIRVMKSVFNASGRGRRPELPTPGPEVIKLFIPITLSLRSKVNIKNVRELFSDEVITLFFLLHLTFSLVTIQM